MNIQQTKYWLIGLFSVLFLAGCQDDDEIFSGSDNNITAFSLTQDGTTYDASFYNDSIIISVAENVSLDGATVSYTISENATILPNPDSISDWDDEAIFSVTSYSGNKQTYKYVIERSGIQSDGSVTLTTQAQVDSLGALGITSIKGNLIIGRLSGTDSITSLSALSQLENIDYNLVIRPTYAGTDLTGLDALTTVGGKINMEDIMTLESISFPSLKSAGSIYFYDYEREEEIAVSLPKLTTVDEDIEIQEAFSSVDFANLKSVGGQILLYDNQRTGSIEEFYFPMLEEVGSIYFGRCTDITKISFPELKTIGMLKLYDLSSLGLLYCPNLEEAGEVIVPSGTSLNELNFPALKTAESLSIQAGVSTMEISALEEVSGDIYLRYLEIEDLSCFSSLKTIGGTLSIVDFTAIETFTAPSSLTSVQKLAFSFSSSTAPSEINVKGLELEELELAKAALIGTKLIGDDEFDGTLTINARSYISTYASCQFPELEGFSTVDSLAFTASVSYCRTMNVEGIKKINKGFYMPYNNITSFSMPDLEEVGGDFTISVMSQLTDETLEFPKLKTIDGDFEVTLKSRYTDTLSFPALESIAGNFTLYTGYRSTYSLTSALFPALATIDGTMTIQAYTRSSSSYVNTKMENLDGFSALTSVDGISISYQSALTSYEGLKNALSSFTADDWSVSNNAYNPTYNDLSNGDWTQE